jgi:hypothetical protein
MDVSESIGAVSEMVDTSGFSANWTLFRELDGGWD